MATNASMKIPINLNYPGLKEYLNYQGLNGDPKNVSTISVSTNKVSMKVSATKVSMKMLNIKVSMKISDIKVSTTKVSMKGNPILP